MKEENEIELPGSISDLIRKHLSEDTSTQTGAFDVLEQRDRVIAGVDEAIRDQADLAALRTWIMELIPGSIGRSQSAQAKSGIATLLDIASQDHMGFWVHLDKSQRVKLSENLHVPVYVMTSEDFITVWRRFQTEADEAKGREKSARQLASIMAYNLSDGMKFEDLFKDEEKIQLQYPRKAS